MKITISFFLVLVPMALLVNPAGGGGQAPEAILSEKLLYTLPDGDAGVARERVIMEFPCESGISAVFNPGETTYITLPSSGHVIDPSFCFVSCRIQCSGFTGVFILPAGGQSLIEQLDITSYGGQTLESLPDYNQLAAYVDKWTLSEDWYRLHGEQEGFPPRADAASELELAQRGAAAVIQPLTTGAFNVGVLATAGPVGGCATSSASIQASGLRLRMLAYCQSFAQAPASVGSALAPEVSGRYLCLPLRHSGLFGSPQYIPLSAFGQIRLAIKWAAASKIFQMVELPLVQDAAPADPTTLANQSHDNSTHADYTINFALNGAAVSGTTTTAGPPPITTLGAAKLTGTALPERHGWRAPILHNSDGTVTTQATPRVIGTYTVTNVKLVAAVIYLSAAINDTMTKALNSNGLPIHFRTWARFRNKVAANSSGQFSFVAPKNVSCAHSVLAFWVTDPADTTLVETKTGQMDAACNFAGTAISAQSNKFDHWQGGVRQWQWRLGTQVYPRFQVRDYVTAYQLTSEAIPKPPMNDQIPCVPMHRYSDENRKFLVLANRTSAAYTEAVGGVSIQPLHCYFHSGLMPDRNNQPNCYGMGVNLQSTPGFELAGQSTVSGAQVSLEMTLYNSTTWGAPYGTLISLNERCQLVKDLLMVIFYRRVLTLGAGMQVSVRE